MGDPKKHHFVPQFYLKGFAGPDEMLWVYDSQTGGLPAAAPDPFLGACRHLEPGHLLAMQLPFW